MAHGKLTTLDLYAASLKLEEEFEAAIADLIRYVDAHPEPGSLPAPVRNAIERLRTLTAEGVDFLVEAEVEA